MRLRLIVIFAIVTSIGGGCQRSLLDPELEEDEVRQMAANWPPYRAPYVPDKMIEAGQNVSDQVRSINRPTVASPDQLEAINVVKPFYEWDLQQTAIDSLGRIGDASVPRLRMVLRSRDPEQRQQAASMLARIGPDAKEAVPDLIAALEDPYPPVRKTAARALGQMGAEASEAVDALFRIIQLEQPPGGGDTRQPVAPY